MVAPVPRAMVRVIDFMPGLLVPDEAGPSLNTAMALLLVSSYTLTISNPKMVYVRLFLAIPAIFLYWHHAFGPYPAPQVQVDIGMALMGMVGVMRVIECIACGIGPFKAPHWVEVGPEGKTLPLPTSICGRLAYAVDYLTSMRGTSWFSGVYWDFAPRSIASYIESKPRRGWFLLNALGRLLRLYILHDCFDTLNKSRVWDTSLAHPITSQFSLPLQLLYALSTGVGTFISVQVQTTVFAIVCVALGSDPSSWPPVFNSPFRATTLADLWTNRWHLFLRRNFNSMSNIITACLPKVDSLLARRFLRITITFALSALLHLLILYGPPIDEIHPHTFFDFSTVAFFMVQPLGLMIEALVIVPLAQHLPLYWRVVATRIWMWGFLLWTGRWWADVWVRRGSWERKEKEIGVSVVRGLLWGKWIR